MIGTHEFGGTSWMWIVPAFVAVAAVCGPGHKRVAVAVGCDWVPKCVVMATGCDWYPKFGGASCMCLVPACVDVAVGCV